MGMQIVSLIVREERWRNSIHKAVAREGSNNGIRINNHQHHQHRGANKGGVPAGREVRDSYQTVLLGGSKAGPVIAGLQLEIIPKVFPGASSPAVVDRERSPRARRTAAASAGACPIGPYKAPVPKN